MYTIIIHQGGIYRGVYPPLYTREAMLGVYTHHIYTREAMQEGYPPYTPGRLCRRDTPYIHQGGYAGWVSPYIHQGGYAGCVIPVYTPGRLCWVYNGVYLRVCITVYTSGCEKGIPQGVRTVVCTRGV